MPKTPVLECIDCIRISVPDLESGLKFYRDQLGHKVLWRMQNYIGLKMPVSQTEIVLDTHPHAPEVFIKVKDVKEAVKSILAGGGSVTVSPYEIEVGFCASIRDPWGNGFVLMDTSKGLLTTDPEGNVTGVSREIK